MNNKNWLWVVLPLMLTGCAGVPVDRSLTLEQASAARNARVFVIIPQDKVLGQVVEVTAGQQYGLVGAVLDAWETSKAYKAMQQQLAPLYQASADVDFRAQFIRALRASGLFTNAAAPQMVDKAPQNEAERRALIASAGHMPVLLVETQYRFDINFRVLMVESQASVWLASQEKPVNNVAVTYYSAPISPDHSWQPARRLQPLWVADAAQRYRSAVNEGIDESIAMLRVALSERPNNVPGAQDRAREFTDYGSLVQPPAKGKLVQGKSIHEAGNRTMVLSPDGRFYSVFTGPTFATLNPGIKNAAPGYGRVFFYWPARQGVVWIQPSVYANGNRLGELSVDNAAFIDLKPGKYVFALKYDGDAPGSTIARTQMEKITPVEIAVQAGTHYFMRFDGYAGVFTKADSLKLLSANVAEPEIFPLQLGGWVK